MGEVILYTYVIDEKNKNLRMTNPLKIVADLNNTFTDIKNGIEGELRFPKAKQLIFFNDAVQPDQSTLNHAAYHDSKRVLDGREMFLYLLTDNEMQRIPAMTNNIGGDIVEARIKNEQPLSMIVKIPKPRGNPAVKQKEVPTNTGEKWACGQCTFTNESTNLNCIICECGRP